MPRSELAAQRLEVKRLRVRRIRRKACAFAATLFLVVWGVIFEQLASGHDPALALASPSRSTTTAAKTTSATTSTTSASAGSTPLTTRQS